MSTVTDKMVDDLAQEIRRVDGNHSLGAGALAEALLPFLTATLSIDRGEGSPPSPVDHVEPSERRFCDFPKCDCSSGAFERCSHPPASGSGGWEAEEKLTAEQAWTILCETPDITSPEEYPDHALITVEQLGSFMARARPELYDADAFMADGEIPMTAAENVLAWLLVEKIGVVDDMNYSPKQAQDIIVAAIDDASSQLVEGGEMLLKAEAVISDLTRLLQAAKEVIECASDTYRKRNGHRGSFEDDSGEKCWIVPFDAFEGLRSAVAAASEGSTDE